MPSRAGQCRCRALHVELTDLAVGEKWTDYAPVRVINEQFQ